MTDTFPGATVRESDDEAPLDEILPLLDLSALSDEQWRQVRDGIAAAMRPLVEAEWAKRGVAVRWREVSVTPAARILVSDDEPDDGLVKDLQAAQVQVWGAAYDALDTAPIWDRVVGQDVPL